MSPFTTSPCRLLSALLAAAAMFASSCAAAPAAWNAGVMPSGQVRLEWKGKNFSSLIPGLFESGWRGASLLPGKYDATIVGDTCRGTIRAPGGVVVDTVLTFTPTTNGIHLTYTLTPQAEVRLNSLHVNLSIAARQLIGGTFTADGATHQFPERLGAVALYSAATKSLSLTTPQGTSLQFSFKQATPVLVQDDRQWVDGFSVRIGPQTADGTLWPGGKALVLDFTLHSEEGMDVEREGPITITAGKDWIPLDTELDIEPGSALDFTHVIPRHTPAGKFGRVIAGTGALTGQFVFADKPDQPARFYGVNLCFTGQYLPHADADRLAERLQRLGYNAVRLHHYESTLVDRSGGSSTHLDPTMLDQLDYLFAALKQRGIYVTTDLFVSRRVFARDVWPGATGDVEMDEFKMAVPVNARAFANYKEFVTNLLTHVNPYTKLRYADDPALAWLSLINEGNEGNYIGRLSDRVKADWTLAWNRWLAARYPDRAALKAALGKVPDDQDPARGNVALLTHIDSTPVGIQLSLFLADTDRDFVRRVRQFLQQDLGCHALLTNLNAWTNPVQLQAVREDFDYVDDHFYVDHPQFLEKPWNLPSRCSNSSPVAAGAPGGRSCAFIRLLDKPFTITEFNYAGPGRYRGVGGILTGALGAVQGWSGIWRFAYSHNRDNLFTPRPTTYFDLAADPLAQASDRASLCLFLRGDMRPAQHTIAITATTKQLIDRPSTDRSAVPDWTSLAWVTRVGWRIGDHLLPTTTESCVLLESKDGFTTDEGAKLLDDLRLGSYLTPDNKTDLQALRLESETNEVTIDAPDDVLTLDTPSTAGGYADAGGQINTKAVSVDIEDTPATVWVSSIDDAPIATSHHMIITHLTDLQDTGVRYASKERQILLGWGKLPHLVHAGRAMVTLRIASPDKAHVYGLTTGGRRTGEIKCAVKDGALVVPLDVDADGKARMIYEVTVTP